MDNQFDNVIDTIKNDIRADLYEIYDNTYGEYTLQMFNSDGVVVVHIYDAHGSATHPVAKEDILEMDSSELDRVLSEILYYNYAEKETA